MLENKTVMSSTTKGLYLGLIVVLLSVLLMVTMTMQQQQKLSWVSFLIIIAGIIWACIKYAKDMNGNVTFGNVFAHGFKTTAVLTIISILYTILAITIIFPEMKDQALEISRQKMEEQGQLSDSDIDKAVDWTGKYFTAFAVGGSLIGYLFMGAIASLIGAAIAKKNPQANNPMM